MKAVSLTGPRELALREAPDPTPPEGGLVLDVVACGLCGSDLRRWKEGPPQGLGDLIPGHEVAGRVATVGPGVSGYSVGDRLAIAPDVHCGACFYCHQGRYNLCDNLRFLGISPGYPGGFAEKMVLTREVLERGIVNPIPAALSFEFAAVSEPCCSVLATHEKAGTTLGDTVAILGAGPVGCLHVSVAKSRGARAIVSEMSAHRREMALQFGPDLIVDAASEDVVRRVREFTGGIGADIVICANPVAATHAQAVEMVRKGGKVLLFGGLPKAAPMTTLDANLIHYGEIEVLGAFSYHPSMHPLALRLLADGTLPAQTLITHRFGLDRIGEAFEVAAAGDALKIIIRMKEDTE